MYIMSCCSCTKECGEVNNVRAVYCSYCGVLIDQIILIACISCGENFRKRGRPQKTAKVDGFSVGCNGGRPHNTTRETGSFVSDGRPPWHKPGSRLCCP